VSDGAAPLGVVELHDVTKTFRVYHRRETTLKEVVLRRRRGVWEEFHALRDVSLRVEPGEAIGFIGRNGAGKSTTLKLLARILQPDSGSITVHGRVSALLELGAGFHPEYSAIENIFLSGAIYGMPRAQLKERVDEILAFAELERFSDNPVKTYSSGMLARLGFAVAVNVDPDVLLIDEVLAVGDKSFAARCFDRMYEFRRRRKTIVLVTHNLDDIESFCDRAVWIDHGAVRHQGAPAEVVRAYRDEVNADDERRSRDELRSGANARAAEVATDHQASASGDLLLHSMGFAGIDGEERDVFHCGETMHLTVRYTARAPVTNPVCEIELRRHDGLLMTSASSRAGGLELRDVSEGVGAVTWSVAELLIAPGQYYVTPRLYDETGHHLLDEHRDWYRFRVVEGGLRQSAGVIALRGPWSHAPNAWVDAVAR